MKFVILSFFVMTGSGPIEGYRAVAPDLQTCEAVKSDIISFLDQDEHEVSFWIDCTEMFEL